MRKEHFWSSKRLLTKASFCQQQNKTLVRFSASPEHLPPSSSAHLAILSFPSMSRHPLLAILVSSSPHRLSRLSNLSSPSSPRTFLAFPYSPLLPRLTSSASSALPLPTLLLLLASSASPLTAILFRLVSGVKNIPLPVGRPVFMDDDVVSFPSETQNLTFSSPRRRLRIRFHPAWDKILLRAIVSVDAHLAPHGRAQRRFDNSHKMLMDATPAA